MYETNRAHRKAGGKATPPIMMKAVVAGGITALRCLLRGFAAAGLSPHILPKHSHSLSKLKKITPTEAVRRQMRADRNDEWPTLFFL